MPVPLLNLLPSAAALASDAELLGRFTAQRDEAAFTELVRRYGLHADLRGPRPEGLRSS